jgi:ribose/xylose/arabinose/galactoside ABC-type transport system permease subunit
MLVVILIVLCIIMTVQSDKFLTTDNLLNVLRSVSMKGIIAFGMTMVIIAGEIDLSVGSMVAFAGCLCAWLVKVLTAGHFMPVVPAVAVAIAVTVLAGTFIGVLSGFLRVRFRVPTFIVTLAWMTALRGIAQLISGGFSITSFPEWYGFVGNGYLWGIPFPAIVFVLVFAVFHFVMNYTAFGRSVYAVGGNAEAARLSGIRLTRVKIAVMATVAGLAAVAGIMVSGQIIAGSSSSGMGWELDVIASVIIGGCSLAGGAGRIWGTFIGVIFLGVLLNGMTILDIKPFWQEIVKGALILVAVLINVAPASKSARES